MLKVLRYKNLLILFFVFIISTILVTCFTVFVIHDKSIKNLKENLTRISQSQNKLIETFTKEGLTENDIISIFKKTYQTNLALGLSGEFVIGKKQNDSIIFLYASNYKGELKKIHITNDTAIAGPMQLALKQQNGFIKGLDYSYNKVYAAYCYNSTLNWGIVTKITQQEIDKPFYEAFFWSLLVALLIISTVSTLYIFNTYPYIEKLIDSENKFRLFFEQSAELIYIYNENGQLIEINESACNILHYTKNEILLHNIQTIENFKNEKEYKHKIKEIIENGSTFYETQISNKSGELIDVEVHVKYAIYNSQKVIVAIAHNISERKQAIQKIIDSERLYRLLTENIKDVVSSFDTTTNKYIYLSPSIYKLRGYTAEEVIALPIDYSLKEEEREATKELIQSRVAEVLSDGKEKYYIDQVQQIRKDGTLVWTELVTTFYLNKSTGNVEVQGVTRDITDRIEAKEALLINEERYRKAQKIGKIGNWEYNIDKQQLWASDEAKRLWNLDINKSVFTLNELSNTIYNWDNIFVDLEELINSNIDCSLGMVIHNNDDKNELITELIAELVFDKSKKPIKISGVIQDITEKKKAENELVDYQRLLKQQNEEYISLNEELNESYSKIQTINTDLSRAKEKAEESDRLKSSFLANMSHEIRTPMNAIVGFSEMLIKPQLSDIKKERYTSIIKERTYDLLRIVEDLLDVSKIEVGQLKIFESNVDMYKLLIDLYEYYNQKLKKSDKSQKITLKLNFEKSLRNKSVCIDGQRVKQIFTNLIDNAFKFTNEGLIEFGCRYEENGKVLFFVHDTGIGIPQEKQSLVFDRFRQADESLTGRQFGGTGLGLSIVKGIIKLMNGSIWLESTENIGSTFFFTLPLSIPTNDEDIEDDKTLNISKKWKNKTVLIVEDDLANIEYLREALSDTGLILFFAENGEQALNQFHTHPTINLILMDIRLPDINGLELTKKIKSKNSSIPIIAQTAYASPIDIKDCKDAGCSDYISKPINYDKLIELIDKYLSLK